LALVTMGCRADAEPLDKAALLESRVAALERASVAAVTLEVRVAKLERMCGLPAAPAPASWWCHAGLAACFRDRDECARKHAQGIAGCEPRASAYCTVTEPASCFGARDLCEFDRKAHDRRCIAVE